MANFQPLRKDTHKNISLKQLDSVDDLANQHAIGIVVQEFAMAASNYPIAFIQHNESKDYFAVAIMGLEQNKNLFITEDNKWEGRYMPARYTHKPLTVAKDPEKENQFAIAIDMDSSLVSEEEGQALFNKDGSETEFLVSRKEALSKYVENEQMTKAFIALLAQHDLLVPQSLKVKVQDKEYNLNGLYIVDEKKLNALPNEAFLEIRERGGLGPIYAHLGSMHQISTLIQRQDKKLSS